MSDHTPYFPDNITDYAPWVSQRGLREPYGLCQCGCETEVPVAKSTNYRFGIVKGQPLAFVPHHGRGAPLEVRFWKYVQARGWDECWLWTGAKHTFGYGKIGHRGETCLAHRVSYELHFGAIPDGLDCLHKCDNPPCCNPYHLFLGTQADNIYDMVAKERQQRGDRHGMAKLTENDVLEIRRLHREGMSQTSISHQYGVVFQQVHSIVRYKSWRHLP